MIQSGARAIQINMNMYTNSKQSIWEKWKLKVLAIACVATVTSVALFVTSFSFLKSDCRDLGCKDRTNSRNNVDRKNKIIHELRLNEIFHRENNYTNIYYNETPNRFIHKQGPDASVSARQSNKLETYLHATKAAAPMFVDLDQSVPDMDALYGQLVVVTAFSLNHMREGMGMIATVQEIMPQVRVIVYDIGINNKAAIKKVETICNVELRTFNFTKYPSYVSSLLTYAWKVIIIKETLNEFGAIFWADSCVRFTKPLRSLLPYAVEHHGYLSRIHSYSALTVTPIAHNYNFTNDLMFQAFGIDKKEYSRSPYAPHLAANRQLIINSSTVQLNYVRPMYTCALNWTCITPPGARHGKHRFDASALMLVIHKFFPYEFSRENDHLKDFDNVMYVKRESGDWSNVKHCP